MFFVFYFFHTISFGFILTFLVQSGIPSAICYTSKPGSIKLIISSARLG